MRVRPRLALAALWCDLHAPSCVDSKPRITARTPLSVDHQVWEGMPVMATACLDRYLQVALFSFLVDCSRRLAMRCICHPFHNLDGRRGNKLARERSEHIDACHGRSGSSTAMKGGEGGIHCEPTILAAQRESSQQHPSVAQMAKVRAMAAIRTDTPSVQPPPSMLLYSPDLPLST